MKPLDPETRASRVVHTRVTPELQAALGKKAKRKRMNLSNLIRNVLEAYLKPGEVEL